MRRKKHKKSRRAVSFYKINYGFRAPFKVLLDGNFVNAVHAAQQGSPAEVSSKLLGEDVKVYTTPCVLHELRTLGDEYQDAYKLCKRSMLLKCVHAGNQAPATDCLLAHVGEKNSEHYFVATQDKSLRERLGKTHGGASIFASVNGVHIEQPSEHQKNEAKQIDKQHMQLKKHELKSEALKDLEEEAKLQRSKTKSIFRKNRAKGPNPLAIKKKKIEKRVLNPTANATAEGEAVATVKTKHRRKRKSTATTAPSVE